MPDCTAQSRVRSLPSTMTCHNSHDQQVEGVHGFLAEVQWLLLPVQRPAPQPGAQAVLTMAAQGRGESAGVLVPSLHLLPT